MSKKYPGLYLYFDWMRGLEKMPPETAMRIICNLYHYAEEERPPQPLEDMHYEILQDMYLEQIKRAKRVSDTNRQNVSTRYVPKAPPLPESLIEDPEELRRALSENPAYADDNIDELVKFRQLCLEKRRERERREAAAMSGTPRTEGL